MANELEEHLPQTAELTGNRRNLIEARYDIRRDDHDGDFFEAYVATLQEAFTDLAAENDELIAIIDRVYEESIEEF